MPSETETGSTKRELLALGVLLHGFRLLDKVYEKLCRAVENRGFVGVHFNIAVVNVHAVERAHDVFDCMQFYVPLRNARVSDQVLRDVRDMRTQLRFRIDVFASENYPDFRELV